ncbi:MAG: hypothetical protein AAFU85_07535 [Planctomycetota bacterium]
MVSTLHDWFALLRRRFVPSATAALVVLGIAAAVIVFYPRRYHSISKVMLRVGRESVSLDPTATTGGADTMSLHRTRENEINTTLEVMKSRQVAELVLQELGTQAVLNGYLDASDKPKRSTNPVGAIKGFIKRAVSDLDPVDPHEQALIELESNIQIDAPKESSVIEIEYRAKSPELARAVVEKWVDSFVHEHIRLNRTEGTFEFFEEQEELLTAELASLQDQIRAHKTEYGLVTVEGQQSLLEQQLLEVRRETANTQSALVASKASVQSLREALSRLSSDLVISEVEGLEDTTAEAVQQKVFELELEEKNLDSRYTAGHPRLIAVRQQLVQVRRLAASITDAESRQEVTTGLNPSHSDITTQWIIESANEAAQTNKLAQLETRQQAMMLELETLNQNESVMAELLRKHEVLKDRYTLHSRKMEQARLNDALSDQSITSVNVIQSASLERRPISPRKTICALLGCLASLAAAVSVALLLDSRHANGEVRLPATASSQSSAATSTLVRKSEGPLPRLHPGVETPVSVGDEPELARSRAPR